MDLLRNIFFRLFFKWRINSSSFISVTFLTFTSIYSVTNHVIICVYILFAVRFIATVIPLRGEGKMSNTLLRLTLAVIAAICKYMLKKLGI